LIFKLGRKNIDPIHNLTTFWELAETGVKRVIGKHVFFYKKSSKSIF